MRGFTHGDGEAAPSPLSQARDAARRVAAPLPSLLPWHASRPAVVHRQRLAGCIDLHLHEEAAE